MRKSTPQPISDVLKNVVEQLSQTKKKDIFKIRALWLGVVGKEFFRHTQPVSLKKGALLVNVDESAWLYQAALEKEQFLKALKEKIGAGKVQKIQFRMGSIND